VPEGIEEQLHRAADGPGIGLPGQHQRAGGGVVDQLLHEAGLADPGFAGDEGDGGHR